MGRPIKSLITALNRTFSELENQGWQTGIPKTMDYACCQSCSWHNFDKDKGDNIVFYHEQDLDNYREAKRENKFNEGWNEELVEESLMLAWSGDVQHLIEALVKNRVVVKWDNSPNTRLRVSMAEVGQPGEVKTIDYGRGAS